MGTIIGYARAASGGSNLGQQKATLLQAGCEIVFEETRSGILPLAECTGLVEVLENLSHRDTLIVCDMNRLSRSFDCLDMVLSDLRKREVTLRVLSRSAI